MRQRNLGIVMLAFKWKARARSLGGVTDLHPSDLTCWRRMSVDAERRPTFPDGISQLVPDDLLTRPAMASKPAKRHLSPAPLPPPKRQDGLHTPSAWGVITSFDNALYDELVFFIFSFLNSRDLCAVQAANKNCSRLACDNQVLAYIALRGDAC